MAAEAAVGFVVETLGNLLIAEAKLLAQVTDQAEDLRLELDRLRSFLQDAEARQNEHSAIQVWISQSRDLAYETEDLLEEFAFRIASPTDNIFKRTVCFLKECYIRRSIGSEIQKLKSKISTLIDYFRDQGISSSEPEREASGSSSQLQQRRTYSHVLEDDFIKLDNDVEMLVGHLVNENESDLHAVVSIFGMGGLGKTTLARKVYNHPDVQRWFEYRAWVCISQQWQKKEILQGILIKIFEGQRKEIMKLTEDELIRKLFQTLRDKKCFVVLDDIWSTDAWDGIKEAFPITKQGSKLLLTTRNNNVALHVSPYGFHHQPRFLSDSESWELLRVKALREKSTSVGHEEMQQMEDLGKEMVKDCTGLPLAVVVLGGILAKKRDIKEWKAVHKNVKAHMGREKNVVEKILELSYDDLPPKLKPCFVYLGMFPEDSDIYVESLYQLWIAEGMILMKDQTSVEESMLDVAEHYLGMLAERSMVQVEVSDGLLTRFSHCRLHDLMRDLSLKKSKEENFFSLVHSQSGFDDQVYKSPSSTDQIHRLVIHFENSDVPTYVPPQRRTTGHLRLLRLLRGGDCKSSVPGIFISQLTWCQMLRVLEINGMPAPFGNDSEEFCRQSTGAIGNLIHLRYLRLSGALPCGLLLGLGNLKQLQTLDLCGAWGLRLPNVLWKLRQLKYLYLPLLPLFEIDNNFRRDKKVRLVGLNKLEILQRFDSEFFSCEDLVKYTNLRLLDARLSDLKYEDILEIILFIVTSKSLMEVNLQITLLLDDSNSLTTEEKSEFLTKLFSCEMLTSLDLYSPIGNLPKYKSSFALHLVDLTLHNSEMADDPMETLERLPNLKYLSLEGECFLGTEMQCCSDGFPQHEKLSIRNLSNFEKWIIAEGAMPNLSFLFIECCPKLEMIPDGLRFIKNLQRLIVRRMPEEFNRRLQVMDDQEGEDFHKIRHVTTIWVR